MDVIGYIRVAPNEQKTLGYPVIEQIEYIRKSLEDKGLKLNTEFGEEGFFIDEDKGGEILNEELLQLLRLVEKKKIEGIIVARFDRISTKAMNIFSVMAKLHENKVAFYSIQDKFNNDNNTSVFIRRVMGYEKQNSSRKIKTALNWKKKNNERLGTTPYGFKTVKKNPDGASMLVEDPEEMEIIKEIFKHKEEGWSLSAIARYLNGRGYQTKNSRNNTKESKWHASTVSYILKNFDLYKEAIKAES